MRVVDAAREAIANNERRSRNGGRFWNLSGGILRCASCGWGMGTATVTSTANSTKCNYYYRCTKVHAAYGDCPHHKNHRADKIEPRVWEFVSGLLKDPERLRTGLEEMIERERDGMRGDPGQEAKAWADKLVESEHKRNKYQEMFAADAMTLDELRAKLTALESTREIARRELAALEARRAQLVELERDRDALLERYVETMPRAIDTLTPDERHRVYKMLKLSANVSADGTLEVSGVFGEASVGVIGASEDDTVVCKTVGLSPSALLAT